MYSASDDYPGRNGLTAHQETWCACRLKAPWHYIFCGMGTAFSQGMRLQVICKVMTGWRPPVPEHLPEACAKLLVRCW